MTALIQAILTQKVEVVALCSSRSSEWQREQLNMVIYVCVRCVLRAIFDIKKSEVKPFLVTVYESFKVLSPSV